MFLLSVKTWHEDVRMQERKSERRSPTGMLHFRKEVFSSKLGKVYSDC